MEVGRRYVECFLNPSAGVIEQSQQQVIPFTLAGGSIDLSEERFHLLGTQISQCWPHGFLQGNDQNPLAKRRMSGVRVKDIAKEAVDGGQASVSSADSVFSRGLQGIEEGKNDLHGEIRDGEVVGLTPVPIGGEAQEQFQSVTIRVRRVLAQVAFSDQMAAEEAGNETGQIMCFHARLPPVHQ